jgi:single-strand DNA-binding protein
MSNGTSITVIGNATADASLRFTSSGIAVATFNVAVTERIKDNDSWKDGSTTFFRCTAWREMGEQCAETITKGMRLIVAGRFKTREYEKDGQTRTSIEIDVEEVGPSLRYAVAQVKKMQRTSGPAESRPAQGGGNDDPWASERQSAGRQSSFDDSSAPPF